MNTPWAEMLQVFFTTVFLPKVGVATAHYYHFTFLQTMLSAGSSSVLTSLLFTFFFDRAIKWTEHYLKNKFPDRNKNKKRFNRRNRLIIKSKRNFGIIGIAAISPVLLSIPLGAFLSIRFFGDKIKTFIWLSVFSLFWIIVFYFSLEAVLNIFK